MFVLDTDTLTHLLRGHQLVVERATRFASQVVLTDVSRMEQLRGRFDAVFKAEDGEALLRAWLRLIETEETLARLRVLPINEPAAAEFDRLRGVRGLKKIGRGDLLIASIVLANKATLVTRNRKDFQKVPGLQIENWVD
jgi:tRNA(fMet)-specific endonuclease VapC